MSELITKQDDNKTPEAAGGSAQWTRQRQRGGRRKNNRPTGNKYHTSFTGRCSDLDGHIFHVGPDQASRFMRTKTELVDYAGRKYGNNVRRAIEDIKCVRDVLMTNIPQVDVNEDTNEIQVALAKEMIKQYAIKVLRYEDNLKKMYSVIHGQCSDEMMQKITADETYQTVKEDTDTLGLLMIIKKICYKYESQQFPPLAAVRSLLQLARTRQGDSMTDIEWYKLFENMATSMTACGGNMHLPGIEEYILQTEFPDKTPTKISDDERETVNKKTQDLMLATIYIENANHGRYSEIKINLENDYLMGYNKYPRDLTEAHKLLINYKHAQKGGSHGRSKMINTNDGVAFSQDGNTRRARDKSNVTCYRCGKTGHYAYEDVCNPVDVEEYKQAKENRRTNNTASNNKTTGTPDEQTSMAQLNFDDAESDGDSDYDDNPYKLMFCTIGADCRSGLTMGDTPSINYDVILSQAKGQINKDWVLLDNQSTVHVMCNPSLLSNIRQVNKHMNIFCNAGVARTNWVGEFPGVGQVWYHKNGIANILSLSKVRRTNRVTFDSAADNIFRLYSVDQTRCREFKESRRGLYYSSMRETSVVLNNNGILTVSDNKKQFSQLDTRRAEKARRLQDILNVPTKELLWLLDNNHLKNATVTRADLNAAQQIFGPSLVGLKGKTVRQKEDHVRVHITPLPEGVLERYSTVELGADIMYVNGIRFFITISRHIQFGTVEMIANSKAATIVKCMENISSVYSKRGFTITSVNMDNQFVPIGVQIAATGVTRNFVSRDEHVPEIERYIRTVKERVRGIQCTLPYKKLPARVTTELVYCQVFWWNALPKRTGVSGSMSPREIIVGLTIDITKHAQLRFGEYVQTHEPTDNDTGHPRTIGALAMRPTGNSQGGHYFYSLQSGRVIHRSQWTRLPMPEEAIEQVHKMAKGSPEGVEFRDRNGEMIGEETQAASAGDNATTPEHTAEADGEADIGSVGESPQNTETNDHATGVVDLPARNSEDSVDALDQPVENVPSGTDENPDRDESALQEPGNHTTPVGWEDPEEEIVFTDEDNNQGDSDSDDESESELETQSYSLRGNRERSYDHLKTVGYLNNMTGEPEGMPPDEWALMLHAMLEFSRDDDQFMEHIHEILLSQYSLKAGIKLFGQRGIEAIKKELKQFHDREVAKPVSSGDLSAEQRKRALAYLMFLKEKRTGDIKGRGCADGRKQRDWMLKEDTTSPTVSVQALILSCMIDACKGRDVATADIPGAFLQTEDTSGETHLKLDGVMLDLLVEVDPRLYSKHIRVDRRGKRYLYLECLKAIYGTLNAALMFWKKLSGDLKQWGFQTNPYDWCVMNKTVGGNQCTILWHVDDIKISHVDPGVVTSVLEQINNKYGRITPLVTTRGKVHDYLGMTIDFNELGRVRFTMHDYIDNMLDELPDGLTSDKTAVTPAADHLFQINNTDPILLDEDRKAAFHTNTAKLLFLAKRARPDIQLPVAFLCTRVKEPDEDDWKKLDRVMCYLRGSIGLPLVLGIDNSGALRWHVDAAFAVHKDMRSHTGATMTMGQGAALSASSKQKINTRSSTEAELVGVDDAMTQIVWTRYFLLAQGFPVKDNIIYQDNQSAIKLEENGKRSSGKRTRHMDIRYFFITDRIKAGESSVEYCPTAAMIADYFTKPLQGSQFRELRNKILGIAELDIPQHNRLAKAELKNRKDKRARKALEDELTRAQLESTEGHSHAAAG